MINPNYKILREYFSEKRKIVITTHRSPDGDALGSSVAIYEAFKNQGHEICIIVPNSFPDYLSFIPNSDKVIIFDQDENKAIYEINNADTFFFLDFNDYCRIDLMESYILKNNGYKIMIDHHQSPSILADQVLSDTTICSTAELVYEFLNELDLNLSLNAAIALYTGIVTDSGSFKYNLVSSRTHLIISNLLSYNINHSEIHKNLYDNNSISRMKLLGRCLNSNFKIFHDFNTAIFYLSKKDLEDCKFNKGDTEGFVNMPLSLKGIVFSALFIEHLDGIKISFRSKNSFDVNKFSRNHFNGGGHKNAAGGKVDNMTLEKTLDFFKSILDNYKNELNSST